LDGDPHGHASAQRRIIKADVLVVHQPVSREAFGSCANDLGDSGAANAKGCGRVVSTPSANE